MGLWVDELGTAPQGIGEDVEYRAGVQALGAQMKSTSADPGLPAIARLVVSAGDDEERP